MKQKMIISAFLVSFGILLAGVASGTPIDISGSDPYASFGGVLDYDPLSGILSISLTNTTNDTYSGERWSDNGAITGIGFYFPEFDSGQSLDFVSFTGDLSYPSFDIPNKLMGYDFGAGTGKTLWGGTVADGIKPGDSARFDFGFSGSIADFTSDSFVNAGGGNFGVIRFQGIGPGSEGSAKIIPTPGGGAQVPEPATVLLLGSGLLGFFGFRKKFGKSKPRAKE